MAADIENYWNQAFARYGTDCLELRLDVVINVLPNTLPPPRVIDLGEGRPPAFVSEPGHHVVFYAEGDAYGNVPPPETYDPYDDDGVAPPGEDFGSPFEHELYSIWSPDLEDIRDLAHEFGHLLGLGDDYDGEDPLPGREGTLMDHGDLIDQNLVNRLAEIVKDSGQRLPECWTGTMDLTLFKDYLAEPLGLPPATCEGSWQVSLSFMVAEDNSISGSAHAELTSGPRCTFDIPGSTSTAEFAVSGTASSDAFELGFPLTSIEPPGDWMGLPGRDGYDLHRGSRDPHPRGGDDRHLDDRRRSLPGHGPGRDLDRVLRLFGRVARGGPKPRHAAAL